MSRVNRKIKELEKDVENNSGTYTKIYDNGLVETSDGYKGYITKDYKFVFRTVGSDRLSIKELMCMIIDFLRVNNNK
tara:strand:+ start:333 stop:563 length:231 start_codon:yes stop_codon:yes gene_type:complete